MDKYPNIEMALAGCVSGHITEWPVLISEIRQLLDERKEIRRKAFEEIQEFVRSIDPEFPSDAYESAYSSALGEVMLELRRKVEGE